MSCAGVGSSRSSKVLQTVPTNVGRTICKFLTNSELVRARVSTFFKEVMEEGLDERRPANPLKEALKTVEGWSKVPYRVVSLVEKYLSNRNPVLDLFVANNGSVSLTNTPYLLPLESGNIFTKQWSNLTEVFVQVDHSMVQHGIFSCWPVRAFMRRDGNWKQAGDTIYVKWDRTKIGFTIEYSPEKRGETTLESFGEALEYRKGVAIGQKGEVVDCQIRIAQSDAIRQGVQWITGQPVAEHMTNQPTKPA